MHVARISVCLLAVCSTAGLTAASAKPVQQAVAIGEPVACIQSNRIRSTTVIDDQTIAFEMVGNKLFHNRLPHGCIGLKANRAFSYAPVNNQLCRVHTIRVIEQAGGPRLGASCGLGAFIPMEKPKP